MAADTTNDVESPPADTSDNQVGSADRRSDRVRGGVWALLAILFFGLLFGYILFQLDPRILYQADEAFIQGRPKIPFFPTYYQGRAFFEPFAARPGGLAEYVGAAASQYFSVRHLAALTLTAVAFAFFLTTDAMVGLMGGRKAWVIPFIPAALLVMIWNQYAIRMGDVVGLLGALVAIGLYLRLRDGALRGVVFLVLLAATYYVAGGACVLFALAAGLAELLTKRRRLLGAAYVIIGLLAPQMAGRWLFGAEEVVSFRSLTGLVIQGGLVEQVVWSALHVFYLLVIAGLALRESLLRISLSPMLARPARVLWFGRGVLMLLLAAGAITRTHNRDVAAFRRLCFRSQIVQSGMGDPGARVAAWQSVVDAALLYPTGLFTPYTARTVNRALYETGRMGSDMFKFPQTPIGGLLPGMDMDQPHKSDTLLQLGAVNRAEHLAMESMEIWGDRPYILRLLARIALAKGDVPSARVFLNRLSKDLVQESWAADQLVRLKQNAPGSDDEIMRIRSVMLTGDVLKPASGDDWLAQLLTDLLQRNPDNRMAFEYQMAHYMLTGQLPKLAENIGRLRDFGQDEIPLHYGEAILLFELYSRATVDLHGLRHGRATREAYDIYTRLRRAHVDRRDLVASLARELPGSYFYYYELLITSP